MILLIINLRKFWFFIAIAAVAFVLSACKYGQQTGTQTGGQTTDGSQQTEQAQPSEGGVTVTYTDSGFEPASVTVSAGQTITWTNNSSRTVQIGSANHPTHTVNPELTGGEFVIRLERGESETVTVTKTGTWGYHDHLRPSTIGSVVVE
ncbi:hypothetical protein A3D04_01685 [Candidatus Curtissbacteria bacterium RIFCSPHIGHO2_02_FULL_40_16b]|uniref:EfeO-type cupredoxin-like domain-containing protein n=1 Tax=Candidatus Curtissbacteria bacterium RIFCSPHIGHO2_02_FULL_40_16b TaxID=1797714 RepID=A0A1F5G8J0_9BACT|nr:MAG: hypothetical protein A3D04_01685 [Candidatus Curtissbacteria bacterium RIFCSPHIGHO2_02_FULL_40_16b]